MARVLKFLKCKDSVQFKSKGIYDETQMFSKHIFSQTGEEAKTKVP